MQRYSRDIKVTQQPGIVGELAAQLGQLVAEADTVKAQQRAALETMRAQIREDFVAGVAAAATKQAAKPGSTKSAGN
jgi:hypothetical protein